MKKTRKCPSDTESKGLTCKECGKRVPQRNNQVNFACQALGYCRYCYRMYFPVRRRKSGRGRKELEQPFSWSARREMEQAGFNPECWSPPFRREMDDYFDARMRGEVRI